MFKSVYFVLKENLTNIYRIFSIARYELLADMRDSRLGLFWNFANPTIQVFTYWFVFGIGLRQSKQGINGVEFLDWMLIGLLVWFFVSKCITEGVSAIYAKVNVITKMKFPVSILPATIVVKQLFNHLCMIAIIFVWLLFRGYRFSFDWFGIFYYTICVSILSIAFSMCSSVLNMFTRDVKKMVNSFIRLFMYICPILWSIELSDMPLIVKRLMKANPLYYIIEGYRDCFFYHRGFLMYPHRIIGFWVVTVVLFVLGSWLMYRFKHKFIDMI